MKKIAMIVTCLLLLCNMALASPLMDFSQGKGSIDLTWRNADTNLSGPGYSQDFAKNYNLEGGLTYGLGNKFAFQFRTFEAKSGDTITTTPLFAPDRANFKLTTNEYNVLYKLDKNLAAYAGLVTAKGTFADLTFPGNSGGTNTRNFWQVGLVGSTEIAKRTTLWANVAAGTDLTNWGVGVSYAFTPSWELNVDYRDFQAKNLTIPGGKVDGKAKGVGIGVTYKF
ncbi:MAG: outer membrane beta-barrel protein [Negativicutes bacterium]|nr:outer membrane beta-barrel protein [Negativicutes bacterium]